MNWSIYAYIPLVWLGFMLICGLIRASYGVGLEMPRIAPHEPIGSLFEQKFDLIKLVAQRDINEVDVVTCKDPKALFMKAWRGVITVLMHECKYYIIKTREQDPQRASTRIRGSIWIGKKRA